jgi:hypothetical protein
MVVLSRSQVAEGIAAAAEQQAGDAELTGQSLLLPASNVYVETGWPVITTITLRNGTEMKVRGWRLTVLLEVACLGPFLLLDQLLGWLDFRMAAPFLRFGSSWCCRPWCMLAGRIVLFPSLQLWLCVVYSAVAVMQQRTLHMVCARKLVRKEANQAWRFPNETCMSQLDLANDVQHLSTCWNPMAYWMSNPALRSTTMANG